MLALFLVAVLLVGVRVAMGGLESDNSAAKDARSSTATSASSTPNGSRSPGGDPLADGPQDPDGLWFQEESEQVGLDLASTGASREEFGTMSGGVAVGESEVKALVLVR